MTDDFRVVSSSTLSSGSHTVLLWRRSSSEATLYEIWNYECIVRVMPIRMPPCSKFHGTPRQTLRDIHEPPIPRDGTHSRMKLRYQSRHKLPRATGSATSASASSQFPLTSFPGDSPSTSHGYHFYLQHHHPRTNQSRKQRNFPRGSPDIAADVVPR